VVFTISSTSMVQNLGLFMFHQEVGDMRLCDHRPARIATFLPLASLVITVGQDSARRNDAVG
jgi:hypothetical protein